MKRKPMKPRYQSPPNVPSGVTVGININFTAAALMALSDVQCIPGGNRTACTECEGEE